MPQCAAHAALIVQEKEKKAMAFLCYWMFEYLVLIKTRITGPVFTAYHILFMDLLLKSMSGLK